MTGIRLLEINKVIRIEEVIGRYFRLYRGSKSGKTLQCHCPFHFDKSHSFKIKVTDQIYECECCHETGDVLDFLQNIEGCTRSEAMDLLIKWYPQEREEISEHIKEEKNKNSNEALRSFHSTVSPSSLFTHTQTLFKMIMDSLAVYRTQDPDLKEAYKKYMVGVAPKELPNPYSVLGNCLIFPLREEEGAIRALAGISLKKGSNPYISVPTGAERYFLFGLFEAVEAIRRHGFVYIVHNYEDVISMHAAGFPNTVAYIGSELDQNLISLLAEYTHKAVVVYNRNVSEQVAACKTAARLNHQGLLFSMAFVSSWHTLSYLFLREGRGKVEYYVRRITRIGWLEKYRKYLQKELAGIPDDLHTVRDVKERIDLFSLRYRLRNTLDKVNRIIHYYYPDPFS